MTGVGTDGRRGQNLPAGVAWAMVAAYVVGIAAHAVLTLRSFAEHAPWISTGEAVFEAVFDAAGLLVVLGSFSLVGAVIVTRRPRNSIGWILLAAGISVLLTVLGSSYAVSAIGAFPDDPPPLGVVASWLGSWTFPVFIFLALVFLPLLYPDGRLPSPRWRLAAWGAGAFGALAVVSTALSARLTGAVRPPDHAPIMIYDIANPIAVGWLTVVGSSLNAVASLLFPALLVLAVAAVTVRFRRSDGVEREQMKWLIAAVAAVLVAVLVREVAGLALGRRARIFDVFYWLAVGAVPIAIGVAVLRYRLYEIDRVLSRTVSYGLLTVLLVGVYAAGVLGLGTVVRAITGGGGGDLVVAASTLAVAAAFGPLRRRVQAVVDRRFNRERYDAQRTVEAFAQRLRDEVDLDALSVATQRVAAETVRPRSVGLWLREKEASR